MIKISLLHPIQPSPVQNWTFDENESVIRIGRATDNHVILYSAVVSRHHVELQRTDQGWSVINLGANGTYLEGQRIDQVPLTDQLIIRLARSGPNLQICLLPTPIVPGAEPDQPELGQPGASTQSHQTQELKQEVEPTYRLADSQEEEWQVAVQEAEVSPKSITSQPDPALGQSLSTSETPASAQPDLELSGQPLRAISPATQSVGRDAGRSCSHPRRQAGMLFCIDCGQPLQIFKTLGPYSLIKPLQSGNVTTTYLAWHAGERYWVTTVNPPWLDQSEVIQHFERQAQPLLSLTHPSLPRYQGYFVSNTQPYLVMHEVPGQSLNQRVKDQGQLRLADAIAVILQVCDVLAHLHSYTPEIVHESICPDSLIQSPSTLASTPITLTGFASLRSWQPGAPLATEGYTAPEVYQGESLPASDLYSLGPTLIYLLTGTDPRTFYAQADQGFRLYPEKLSGVSSDLVAVLYRLTNPHPEDRYGSAQEVAAALRQLNVS